MSNMKKRSHKNVHTFVSGKNGLYTHIKLFYLPVHILSILSLILSVKMFIYLLSVHLSESFCLPTREAGKGREGEKKREREKEKKGERKEGNKKMDRGKKE